MCTVLNKHFVIYSTLNFLDSNISWFGIKKLPIKNFNPTIIILQANSQRAETLELAVH